METTGKNKHGVLAQTEFFRDHKKGLAFAAALICSQEKFITLCSYLWLLLSLFFLAPSELIAQQNKTNYKVAIDKEYEPYEFLNDENKADGFTPSLLTEIGKKTGVTFEFIPMTWPAAIKALESGEVDIINMIISQERALQFDFSQPHSLVTQALFRNVQNEEIENINSLSMHKVGFQIHDISLTTLQNRTDFEKHIDDSKLDGLLNLNVGGIDALFCAEQAGIRLVSKYGFSNIKLVEGNLFPQNFAFATRKGNLNLLALLNQSLAELQKSGKLKEMKEKWLTGQLATPGWLERNQTYLLSFGCILGLSLILLLIWNRTLQHRVLRKTKTLQASEERFRQLAESIDEVFWMTDPSKKKILYISPSYEDIWGRSCKSLYDSPESWIDAIHPEDRNRVLEAALTRQVNASYKEVFRIIRPDGKIRWIRDSAFPIQDASGEVYRITGIALNITEQKIFEEELNDRDSKIHSLLRISRGLEKTGNYSDVIDVIYDEIYKTIGIASVWIYLFDEKLEYATLTESRGTVAAILKNSAPVLHIKGDPFLEEIALATHTVIIEDAATDPRTDKKIVAMLGNRTIINVPTILVEHHIGSLGLGTFGNEGLKKLTPSEIDYLSSIGSHVASAIDRIQFIGALKKIQEELLEKEERYRGLSEASFEAIFISANGICIEQNLMAEKMFGFTIEEAVGKPGLEWLIPEDRERVRKYIAEDNEEPYESIGLRKDGSTFPCLVHGRTMFYREKNVRVTSVTDISERKRAEELLKESEQRYHTVLKQSLEAIYMYDVETQHVVEANLTFLNLLGYTQEEINSLTLFDIVAHDRVEVETYQQNILSSRGISMGERRWRRKDGTTVQVEVTANKIELGGRNIIFLVGRDITERKRTEEKILQQLEELQRWHNVTLEREDRMIELKQEVNQLLQKLGNPKKYLST